MPNKIKYGLCNVYYAKGALGVDNTVNYATPVKLSGGVSLSLKPVGDSNSFYADNIEYYNVITNNGYDGELELAILPDEFRKDILKEVLHTDNVLYEDSSIVTGENFALMFQFEGDVKARRHVLYWCSAQRPEMSGSTKSDKTEPQTEKLTFTARPSPETLFTKASTTEATEASVYNNWFTNVYTKPTV